MFEDDEIKELIDGLLDKTALMITAAVNHPKMSELMKLNAKLFKQAYDAYIEAGFTPEQAITLLAHAGAGVNFSQKN